MRRPYKPTPRDIELAQNAEASLLAILETACCGHQPGNDCAPRTMADVDHMTATYIAMVRQHEHEVVNDQKAMRTRYTG